MDARLNNLKSEKLTFTVIIGILLFSLVYISTHTLSVKSENEKFRQSIRETNENIELALSYINTKDSTIIEQKQRIISQANQLRQQINSNRISERDRQVLTKKMTTLRSEAISLKTRLDRISKFTPVSSEEQPYVLQGNQRRSDSLLRAYKREITSLQRTVNDLQRNKPATPKVVVQNKLATYFFSARASDRKNRALRTEYIVIQLQLQGDLSTISCRTLQIEIRDPNNTIITTGRDRIRASTDYITDYMYKLTSQTLTKGRYSVRIYCEDSDFQAITFMTLV